MRNLIGLIAVVLLAAAPAAAQAQASCDAPEPGTVTDPNTVTFFNENHAITASYTMGAFAENVVPSDANALGGIRTIPAGAVNAGLEPNCKWTRINDWLLGVPISTVVNSRLAIKIKSTDGRESRWADVSNPFLKAGAPAPTPAPTPAPSPSELAPVTGVRVRRL